MIRRESTKRRIFFAVWLIFFSSLYLTIPFLKYRNYAGVIRQAARTAVITATFFTALVFWGRKKMHSDMAYGTEKKVIPSEKNSFAQRIEDIPNRIFFMLIFSILVIFWIPAYLALFPGTFGYDGPIQFSMFTGELPLSSHHPLLHTWMLGSLIFLGKAVFGSYNAGLAVYSATQGIILAASLSFSLLVLRRMGVGVLYLSAAVFWLAMNPLIQTLVFATTKDVVFSAMLLDFVVLYVWNGTEQRKHPVLQAVFGTLMCLMRSQGIYIVAAVIVIELILLRRVSFRNRRICIITALLLSAVAAGSFNWVCAHVAGIPQANKREMMSVPMQQMAAVINISDQGGEPVTKEQRAMAIEVISEKGIRNYQAEVADPVKDEFNTEQFLSNPGRYLKLYLELGIQHKREYIVAAADLVAPYWDMSQNSYRYLAFQYTFEDLNKDCDFHRNSMWKGYEKYMEAAVIDREYQNLPVPAFLFDPVLGNWVLMVVLGWAIAFWKKTAFYAQLFPALYFLTLMLGPVALLRYIFPVVVAIPFIIGCCLVPDKACARE